MDQHIGARPRLRGRRLFAFVGLLVLPGSAIGVEPGALSDSLRLADLLALAAERNPSVLAAGHAWRASESVPSRRGALPDPVLGFSLFLENIETRVGPQESRISLQQTIPWPGKLGDRAAAAKAEARAVEMDSREVLERVRLDVSLSYYDLRWLETAARLLRDEEELLSHMEEVARVKYGTGTAGQQDVLKVQVEQANVRRRILEMEQMISSARSRLRELLDLDSGTSLGPAAHDPPRERADPKPVEELEAMGLERRPGIAASRHRLHGSKELLAHARKGFLPDIKIGVDVISVGNAAAPVPDSGKDAIAVGASINLPIWIGKVRAGIREAEARSLARRSEVLGHAAQVRSQVQDALFKVRTSLETVRMYETAILPQAEQTFFATQAAYQTGTVDFLTYLDSERSLFGLRIAYQRALADLGQNHARLERAVGAPLDELLTDATGARR